MRILLRASALPLAGLALIGLSSVAHAQNYNASQYFATNNNPAGGMFQAGSETTPNPPGNPNPLTFIQYQATPGTYTSASNSGETLQDFNASGNNNSLPALLNNNTNTTFTDAVSGGTLTVDPGELVLHPGANGQYSVLRFIAPTAGQYAISANFLAADNHPATTDVHVQVTTGGLSLFSSNIDANSLSQTYTGQLTLSQGENVDFAVGFGSNQNYYYDSTGLKLSIAAVPELSTMLGFGSFLTIGGLAALRQRKQARLNA